MSVPAATYANQILILSFRIGVLVSRTVPAPGQVDVVHLVIHLAELDGCRHVAHSVTAAATVTGVRRTSMQKPTIVEAGVIRLQFNHYRLVSHRGLSLDLPSFGTCIWVCVSELFPNNVRARAASIATMLIWISCLMITFTFLTPVRVATVAGAYWIYATMCSVSFTFIFFMLPETRGKTLEEVQACWRAHK